MVQGVVALENGIQEYAWGSRTFLPELLGAPSPASRPQAEMWMGAHPASPSRVRIAGRSVRLDTLITEQPVPILGQRVAERFGGRLPFLMKVLAAAGPLSIQAHPDKTQAERGWARDNAAGLAADSAERSYRDDNHKPEIMAPLGDLWALHGFRPIAEAAGLLRRAGVGGLEPLADAIERHGPPALIERLFTMPAEARILLVGEVRARARERLGEPVGAWVERLHASYPGDAGVLAPLFLNLVLVPRGRAVYLGPGELHAYLDGAGVELMANSDNVLRGGLTPKRVDLAELLAILDPTPRAPDSLAPSVLDTGEEVFETPAPEFRLSRIALSSARPFARPASDASGPEIHLVTEGSTVLSSGGVTLALERGQSCLVPAAADRWSHRGDGVVYRARVP